MWRLLAVLICVSVGKNFKYGPEISTFVDACNSFSVVRSTWAEGELWSKREFLQTVISSALCTETTSHRCCRIYRVRQKYLMILQNSCEWNLWRGVFVLETRNISVAMERWSVEHRAFAVETYFKNKDSVLTQKIFRRHFNIHRNDCP